MSEMNVTGIPFTYGVVFTRSRKLSEEHVAIVQEFTEAISLGYLRFLDFQQLEEQAETLKEQAEQARRERAVERVRAEAMAMQGSADIGKVMERLWQGLRQAGIRFQPHRATLNILDRENDLLEIYNLISKSLVPESLAPQATIVQEDAVEGTYLCRAQIALSEAVRRGWAQPEVQAGSWKAPDDFAEQLQELWGVNLLDPREYENCTGVSVPFAYGGIFALLDEGIECDEGTLETFSLFADAVSLGYTRFLDFQRLEAQNQILEETTRRKSDFLARMSHDLRTPMNAIIGYTRILLRRARDRLDDRQYRNLENIQVSSNNLLSLINEILDLSRVEAGRVDVHPQQVDLKQLATECAASVESLIKPDVQLIQQVDDVPSVRTDPDILRKVLMNLLSNAVKFTEEGSITVSVRPAEGGIEVSVADTGVGIPAEDLPHIFDEFQQVERQGSAEKEGTGLGLAIAKKSVNMLGGTIWAESEVGKGTTFTLRIVDYQSPSATQAV